MAQVVHYSAHGSSGLVFDCYMDELRAHLNSKVTVDTQPISGWSAPRLHYAIKAPKGRTDLSHVTCPSCWKAIHTMASMKVEK